MKYFNDLKRFKDGMTDNDIKKNNINIKALKDKNLVSSINKKYVNHIMPENKVPKWASKFKFTRRKYGIIEEIVNERIWKLTKKGINMKRSKPSKTVDEVDKEKNKMRTLDDLID